MNKQITVSIPEKPYYTSDVILGLMEENQIAFKGKSGTHVCIASKKKLSKLENESIFNLLVSFIRYDLEKQGLIYKQGESIELNCLNCLKPFNVPYKERSRKFCGDSCSSRYNAIIKHKEGKINLQRNKRGQFVHNSKQCVKGEEHDE